MTIPWGLLQSNPSLVVLVPFAWFLWQLYVPPFLDRLVGYKPNSDEHLYETAVTKKIRNVFSQIERVDENVERVADTQEDLVNITLAQTHQLNGHEGKIDVDAVEQRLIDDHEDRPSDFLHTERNDESEDTE